jgi:hypothetical protein
VAAFLIVIGVLVALVALACATFAWNGRRLARSLGGGGVIDATAVGDAGPAPLSGRHSAWWRVAVSGGETRVSSDTMRLDNGTVTIELRASAVDPHPEERKRFACATDPLTDPEAAQPHELFHDAVADTPYVAEEYSVAPGERVTVLAVRQADGMYGRPPRGQPRVYASGKAAQITDNARRGSRDMARLAASLGAAAAVLIVAGIALG